MVVPPKHPKTLILRENQWFLDTTILGNTHMYLHPILQQTLTLQTHGYLWAFLNSGKVFAWSLAVLASVWVTQAHGSHRALRPVDASENPAKHAAAALIGTKIGEISKKCCQLYLDNILSLRDRFHLVERWFADVLMKN